METATFTIGQMWLCSDTECNEKYGFGLDACPRCGKKERTQIQDDRQFVVMARLDQIDRINIDGQVASYLGRTEKLLAFEYEAGELEAKLGIGDNPEFQKMSQEERNAYVGKIIIPDEPEDGAPKNFKQLSEERERKILLLTYTTLRRSMATLYNVAELSYVTLRPQNFPYRTTSKYMVDTIWEAYVKAVAPFRTRQKPVRANDAPTVAESG